MATVTYKNQPGIDKTKGKVALEGNNHRYTVSKLLWPEEIETLIRSLLIGKTLHVCCGKSSLGDIRADRYEQAVDVILDANRLPFASRSFETVLIDPPYNGKFQWNHDMLSEMGRVAKHRFIFQHWFVPVDKNGRFKKDHSFKLIEPMYNWMPQSYFGRIQVISVFDRVGENM